MLKGKLTGFIVIALLLFVLAACGSKTTTPQEETPQQAGGQQESARPVQEQTPGQAETRFIEHLKGTIEVPAKIERVVVLSAAYVDHLLAIGEKPIGINVEVRYGGDYLPYLASQLEGVALVGSAEAPNLEAILELNPDVIIVENRTAEAMYEQLIEIAPTIVLGAEWLGYADDWTKDLLTIAQLYDKTDIAEQKISELQQKVAAVKEKVVQLDNRQLAYLRIREKAIQIYASEGHPTNTLLYQDIGFLPADLTPQEQRENLSLEVIPEIGADYIVLETDVNAGDMLQSMNESALWSNLAAVQNNDVYHTDSFWLFKGWGVIGRSEIVDEVMQLVQ